MTKIVTDVLVIGAGLAGERTAAEVAARGFRVTMLSLVPPRRSHSTAAQGGMQAALGNMARSQGDSADVHFEDTVKGADWGLDEIVGRRTVENAGGIVRNIPLVAGTSTTSIINRILSQFGKTCST